jgi:hypothetical protein
MPLTPITPKAPSREGTSTTLSYEFNHETLSTLELPWQGLPYGNLINPLQSPIIESKVFRTTRNIIRYLLSDVMRHDI